MAEGSCSRFLVCGVGGWGACGGQYFWLWRNRVLNKTLLLHRLTMTVGTSGCSSARLEYTSGGRVVAGSNPVTPTVGRLRRCCSWAFFGVGGWGGSCAYLYAGACCRL